MEELITKAIDGLGALGALVVFLAFMYLRRRDRSNGTIPTPPPDLSKFVTKTDLSEDRKAALITGERLHHDTRELIQTARGEAKEDRQRAAEDRVVAGDDRQNLFDHVSNHPGPSG